MHIVAFLNLGYGHEAFPAFLTACDDVREGRDTAETRMILWSKSGRDVMDRSKATYFLNDADGAWRWSERAQCYLWVTWEGEQGGYHLPQFNWGDPGGRRKRGGFWSSGATLASLASSSTPSTGTSTATGRSRAKP
jgi:hypothetical protein